MPIVTIQQSPRSRNLKRHVAEKITTAFVEAYGLPADAVQIFFAEAEDENWAKGGVLASDRNP
ncbi:MAG: tautomerase family protein [Roseovarius sp.]|jgi:4-oxalocrotonate tautomerase|nr:tautomerase family protein [Roseovarius sp.]MBQ0751438.1 tautomerase family protein [Roseovarius sp.]MBQ0809543.1 tautomerase family protein [Roseovarius sp.]